MPAYRLTAQQGTRTFDLPPGRALVLGRSAASDVPVYDPTISRRHAELTAGPDGVQLRDLESSNGTSINGERVAIGLLRPGDTVTFGRVNFRLEVVSDGAPATRATPAAVREATIVRELQVAPGVIDVAENAGTSQLRLAQTGREERLARKLSLLLEVSQKLASEFDLDRLLQRIAEITFEIMNVDRVAVLLADGDGELTPRISRNRLGENSSQAVPRSIAAKVREQRVAVLTQDAASDVRFQGHSIVAQQVRSAICSPLMASADEFLGVLYVDNVTATNLFSDEDLQFLVAFSGIAALAIASSRSADQLRRQALVRSNFERYFAPNVAAEIAGSEASLAPGGERRVLTVMFSDIRGFTTLSESMPPEEVAQLLSDYFSEMVDIIFEHGGTLDKFIGDAIMALWGAPARHDDDPDRALAAAVDMQEAVALLNERWRARGRPEVGIGIGINHGDVFAGNIGSPRRLEYTVLGDAVNIASRLCAQAGAGDILAGEAFRNVVSHPERFVAAPDMTLRGRAAPVQVYRVKR
ncbi:MAG TPA: adenylate/guanylate cyclase domain-containing protein [Gemmatimonadales bacterium]|nr:adenylate/guanylate cyclase domain-containing protein [Gemmatimonadales bacterium]